jgi:hypothetical protein
MNPKGMISTEDLGKAMIKTSVEGFENNIIYNKDIVVLANG